MKASELNVPVALFAFQLLTKYFLRIFTRSAFGRLGHERVNLENKTTLLIFGGRLIKNKYHIIVGIKKAYNI